MAKAASKPTPQINWVSLKDARERVAEAYSSAKYAQRWLLDELATGHVRWEAAAQHPRDECLAEFWRNPALVEVDWADSSATAKIVYRGDDVGLVAVTAYSIRLAWEDIEARLSGRPTLTVDASVPARKKEWLTNAKQRYPRRSGEKTAPYAERLEPLMRKDLGEGAWPADTIRRRLYDK
jgi:hypothetical protein